MRPNVSVVDVTLHFATLLVMTITNGQRLLTKSLSLSLIQASREENEMLKLEIESIKKETAKQASRQLTSILKMSLC